MYQILLMSQAQKDAKKLASSGLKPKALELLALMSEDPFCYTSRGQVFGF